MKLWSKIRIKDKNKDVELVAKALTNYLYGYGPILDICRKYNIAPEDRYMLEQYSANRISGLLLLFLSKDYHRINDIANKYDLNAASMVEIIPEIEGYVEK